MPTTITASPTTITQDPSPIVAKVRELLENGEIPKADAIGIRLQQESSNIAMQVAQAAIATRNSAVPEVTPKPESQTEAPPSRLTALPFAQLAAHPALLERGINLQEELDSHVQMMINMGIISEDQRTAYAQKFATISVNTEELAKTPKNWRPQLFLDDMTPDQALNAYIKNTQVSVDEWVIIDHYKNINPDTKQRLPETQQLPSGLARFTFTAKILTGKTADHQLKQQTKGTNHMQPKQWLQMFMEDLNTAIKTLNLSDKPWKDLTGEEKLAILPNRAIDQFLPDVSTVTQFPEYRDENGSVLGLYWHPNDRRVNVNDYNPGVPGNVVGVRKVLG